MISFGISSYNCKQNIPNDIETENNYLPPENIKFQQYLDQIEEWTASKQIKLNCQKSKYMTFNFTNNYQMNTRLRLENTVLEQNTVWHSSLTQGQEMEIERVQKVGLRILLKDDYENYDNASML